MRQNKAQMWGFLAPTFAILIFIGVIPVFYILYLSMFRHSLFARVEMVYTGFENFRRLVFDPHFLRSLRLSLLFVALCCAIQIPLGLLIANFLNLSFKGKGIFRTIMSLPLAMAPISVGAIWVLMTNPDIGPLPIALRQLGFDYNIGLHASQAFWTTVLMNVWQWTPFVTLAFMAGLSVLPKEPYEASLVDGANRWQVLRYVTLPLLKPIMLTILFIRIMDAFRAFDEVWMLTGGGPGMATRFVSIHVVRQVIVAMNYGYGSAISLFLLYLTIVLCWLLLTFITASREAT
ncbi:MAG TPA: sugar ABC transporter permease [Atribacteraceae bacterium]|nr:sugar ABC transporter permease [Atribacteraceae bacterium]